MDVGYQACTIFKGDISEDVHIRNIKAISLDINSVRLI